MTTRLIRKAIALLAAAGALAGIGVALASSEASASTRQALCVSLQPVVNHLRVCPLNA
jgi:hypothetical protein